MKTKPTRPSRSRKLLLAIPAAAAAAPVAHASVIFTNVNGGSGLTISGFDAIYFTLSTQTYGTTYNVDADFTLNFYLIYNPAPVFIPKLLSAFPYSQAAGVGYSFSYPYTRISRLGNGAPINSSLDFYPYSGQLNGAVVGWQLGDRGFAGLQLGSNYGWADIKYESSGNLTLFGFGYENVPNQTILAGQTVPEPAETAAIGALMAGSVAALAARRKRKLAKAA